MKKVVAIILTLLIVFSIGSTAMAKKDGKDDTPVIIIPGFVQTHLYYVTESGEKEAVWMPDILSNLGVIGESLPEILQSLFDSFSGDPEGFGDALIELILELAGKMKSNPDGSGTFPLYHYENLPEKRNMAYIKNGDEPVNMFAYYTVADYICEEGYADEENVFVFEYDSRLDPITIAAELRTFIKDVKAYTQKDKVNVMGISYGGQIAETYLHYYMDDEDVKKVVLSVPSLLGTNFGDRLLNGTVEFALDDVIGIVENISRSDTGYNKILTDADPEFFSRVLNGISEGTAELVKYWSSVYSITSTEYYEGLKAKFLDPVKSAEMIRINDIIHYEVMPKVDETLHKCMEKGIEIAIHACSGLNLALGGEENSDLLLRVKDVTGATCAPMGKRFANGFTGAKTECSDPLHNHVSPSMEVDASTAFLPEHTWFVDGSHHAMFQYEDYGIRLAAKALCTDELKDVHSSKEFPQFVCSDNPNNGVYAEFDYSTSGFITEEDSSFLVKNIFTKNKIRVLSVKANGMDANFSVDKTKTLAPGESLEIPFDGRLPEESPVRVSVTVKYIKFDAVSVISERKFDFTVLGGKALQSTDKIVENEFYNGDTSGMPLIKRAVLSVTYIFDALFVLVDFLFSDAFKYLI